MIIDWKTTFLKDVNSPQIDLYIFFKKLLRIKSQQGFIAVVVVCFFVSIEHSELILKLKGKQQRTMNSVLEEK